MKVFENLQRLKTKRHKSLKNKIDKLLVLHQALQYENWFVDLQSKILGTIIGIILTFALYGALRLFCHIILLLP